LEYKYLEELGVRKKECDMKKLLENDRRMDNWLEAEQETGVFPPDCWNLNITMAMWMYSHLRRYLEESCVDLTYYKFQYKDKEYTQREAIDFMTDGFGYYIVNCWSFGENEKEAHNRMKEACEMWSIVFPVMWW